MATKQKNESYHDFVSALKPLTSLQSSIEFPKLSVVNGPSDFLRMKAALSLKNTWSRIHDVEAQTLEASEVDQASFYGICRQSTLFDPESLYFIRRCDKSPKIAAWLKDIKNREDMRNHIVIELGEKIPAELQKQCSRLNATFIPCFEPTNRSECIKILHSMARREGVSLTDDASALLVDAMGLDLARLENEVRKLGMVYIDCKEPLRPTDIASQIGNIREDHVFELFNLLRLRHKAKAQLLIDQLMDRGEKAIAITGILARYAREILPRNPRIGLRALALCAHADVTLKSTSMSEVLILGTIVDALVG